MPPENDSTEKHIDTRALAIRQDAENWVRQEMERCKDPDYFLHHYYHIKQDQVESFKLPTEATILDWIEEEIYRWEDESFKKAKKILLSYDLYMRACIAIQKACTHRDPHFRSSGYFIRGVWVEELKGTNYNYNGPAWIIS